MKKKENFKVKSYDFAVESFVESSIVLQVES